MAMQVIVVSIVALWCGGILPLGAAAPPDMPKKEHRDVSDQRALLRQKVTFIDEMGSDWEVFIAQLQKKVHDVEFVIERKELYAAGLTRGKRTPMNEVDRPLDEVLWVFFGQHFQEVTFVIRPACLGPRFLGSLITS